MTYEQPSTGQYLYGIVVCPEPREFKIRGIGERGDVVHTINYRRLAAVVSDSPVIDYDESRRNMMAHTKVLEEVMEEFSVLPARFSTVAPSADAIGKVMLPSRYDEFTQMLGQIEGRMEFGLKAFWREDAIFQEVVAENEGIRKMRDSVAGRSVEATYHERIALGEAIEKAMAQKRWREEELILSRIRPHVYKARSNKTVGDRMVLNAAFLVDAPKEPAVDAAVQKLGDEFSDRLMFKYVGPTPPYNFVSIVVNWEPGKAT